MRISVRRLFRHSKTTEVGRATRHPASRPGSGLLPDARGLYCRPAAAEPLALFVCVRHPPMGSQNYCVGDAPHPARICFRSDGAREDRMVAPGFALPGHRTTMLQRIMASLLFTQRVLLGSLWTNKAGATPSTAQGRPPQIFPELARARGCRKRYAEVWVTFSISLM